MLPEAPCSPLFPYTTLFRSIVMRWWIAVVVCTLFVPAARAQDGAQKLYEAMEQKLSKAKAHKIGIEHVGTAGPWPLRMQSTLRNTKVNKLKLTFEGQEGKRA